MEFPCKTSPADPLPWSWPGPGLGQPVPFPRAQSGWWGGCFATGIHADRQGMPGARELSFTAPPRAVCSRGHIPADVWLSTSHLSCPRSSAFPSFPTLQKAQQIPNLALTDTSPVWASHTQSQFLGLLCTALSRVSPAALAPPHLSSGSLTCTQGREMPGRAGAAPDSSMSWPCRAPRGSSPVCPSILPRAQPSCKAWAAVIPVCAGNGIQTILK